MNEYEFSRTITMNDDEFSKRGIKAEEIFGYGDYYLLTEDHLDDAMSTLKEAVKVMEAVDLEKADLKSVYKFAAKVSTAASRIKKIQLHETLLNQMSECLLEKMAHGVWYTRRDIKSFLSSTWRNSAYYQYRCTTKEPWHHIDVLLERLTVNGILKAVVKNGMIYYSSVAFDF